MSQTRGRTHLLIATLIAIMALALLMSPALGQEGGNATGTVTISGTPAVDDELTATAQGVDDPDGLPTSSDWNWQWQSSTSQGTWTDISGATASEYTPTGEVAGHLLRVKLTFTDDEGNAEELTSDPTGDAVVADGALWSAAIKAGEQENRHDLFGTTTLNGWKPSGEWSTPGEITDDRFNYNGHDFALTGLYVTHNGGQVSLTIELDPAASGDANSRPYLTLTVGTGDDEAEFSFGTNWSEETVRGHSTLSRTWHSSVDRWNNGDTVTVTIEAEEVPDQVTATGNIDFTGEPVVGTQITATPRLVFDPNGLTPPVDYQYQWSSSADGSTWTAITGADAASYTPTDADAGMNLRVTLTFQDDAGNSETLQTALLESDPTILQRDRNPEAIRPMDALWAATITAASETGNTNSGYGWKSPSDPIAEVGTLTDNKFYNEHDEEEQEEQTQRPTHNYVLRSVWHDPTAKTLQMSFVERDSGSAEDRAALVLLLGPDTNRRTLPMQEATVTSTSGTLTLTWDETDLAAAGNPLGWQDSTQMLLQIVDDPNQDATGTMTITGTTQAGETLTAIGNNIADGNGAPAEADWNWQWQSRANTTE